MRARLPLFALGLGLALAGCDRCTTLGKSADAATLDAKGQLVCE